LVNNLGGAVHKLLNKRSCIPLWKKYDVVVLLARYCDIPTMALTTVLKNKDKINYNFFLSEYT